MKKLLAIILAASLFVGCKTNGFEIEGTINSAVSSDYEGKTVELKKIGMDEISSVATASTTITDSKFKLSGEVDTTAFYFVTIDNNPNLIILEKGKIVMNVDLESPMNSTTKGTPLNDKFEDFKTSFKSFNKDIEAIREKSVAATEEENETLRNEYENKIAEIVKFQKQFVSENNNLVGAYVFTMLLDSDRNMKGKEASELYADFSEEIKSSIILKGVPEYLESIKTLEPGDAFLDLTEMQDPEGNAVNLSNYVGKGKYVLVDFWASWCPPCRAANPSIVELYNKFNSKGFDIVGVSLDKEGEGDEWRKAIKDDKLVWNHMSDLKHWDSEARLKYKLKQIPSTILFDREGKVIDVNLSIDEINNKLELLLN